MLSRSRVKRNAQNEPRRYRSPPVYLGRFTDKVLEATIITPSSISLSSSGNLRSIQPEELRIIKPYREGFEGSISIENASRSDIVNIVRDIARPSQSQRQKLWRTVRDVSAYHHGTSELGFTAKRNPSGLFVAGEDSMFVED